MSRLQRKLSPLLSATLTHPRTRDARRRLADLHRRVRSAPHRVLYFHQVDDPYGHLAAQVLGELVTRYEIVLEPHLVGPPPDDAAPEPERLEAFARKDAADVAPFCGLEFPDAAARPAPESVELATRLLAGAIAAGRFEQDAARIGDALWRGGHGQLEEIARDLDTADEATARRAIDAGNALRRKRGHYLGAMLHYGGEWYWGVDRLGHLERRLQGLGVLRPGQRADEIVSRPDRRGEPPLLADRRLRLECFPSLRSPYTAIALRRVLALPERLPVEIVWRPVLPMVMRGLPVPSAKRLYILFDTKREAELIGEPFGHVCDPVGRPVERGLSLWPFARAQGREGEYLHAFTRAAFAEGVDTGTDAGLRHVVEEAGLAWDDARPHLDGEGWREEVEENRRVLMESGLWGVPSFRLLGEGDEPDFSTWGQDRLWLVEEILRRRVAPTDPSGDTRSTI
jgi:2-hydroxychromene-2-carboxylate isomerase